MNFKIPKEILGDWNDLDKSKLNFPKFKYVNRSSSLIKTWNYMSGLEDYLKLTKNKKVIDIGSGNGAAMEIFRHFKYDVLAVDRGDREMNHDFKLMIESQKIPFLQHDCCKIPYPIESQSYDILLAMGSIINILGKDMSRTKELLNEFSRISKHTIFLVVNNGPHLEQARFDLMNWQHNNFKLTSHINAFTFRYDKG